MKLFQHCCPSFLAFSCPPTLPLPIANFQQIPGFSISYVHKGTCTWKAHTLAVFSSCLQKQWLKWIELLPNNPIWDSLATVFIVKKFDLCSHDWLWLESWEAAMRQRLSLLLHCCVTAITAVARSFISMSLAAGMLFCCHTLLLLMGSNSLGPLLDSPQLSITYTLYKAPV